MGPASAPIKGAILKPTAIIVAAIKTASSFFVVTIGDNLFVKNYDLLEVLPFFIGI
jgi:hypothetical protein